MRRLSFLACAVAAACSRTIESNDAAPAASVSSAVSASASAATTAGAPIASDGGDARVEVRLVVRTGDAGGAVAYLVSPALGLDERVADLRGTTSCSGFHDTDDRWVVTCTPAIRVVKLALRRTATKLVLEQPGRAPRELPIDAGPIAFVDGNVSERNVPGYVCPGSATDKAAEVRILTHAELVDNPTTWVRLVVAGQEIELAALKTQMDCTSDDDGAGRVVMCGGKAICALRVHPGAVQIACQRPTSAAAVVLVPCGPLATLPTGKLSQTVHYH